MRYGPILLRMVRLAVGRPTMVVPLLSAAWRFRARDWYRRAPFLPLPPRQYLAWRLHTAYGDQRYLPAAGEIERYLRWASHMRVRTTRKETSS